MQRRAERHEGVLKRQRLQALVHRMRVVEILEHGLGQVVGGLLVHVLVDADEHHIGRGPDVLAAVGLIRVGARGQPVRRVAGRLQILVPSGGADDGVGNAEQAELLRRSELVDGRGADGARAHEHVELAVLERLVGGAPSKADRLVVLIGLHAGDRLDQLHGLRRERSCGRSDEDALAAKVLPTLDAAVRVGDDVDMPAEKSEERADAARGVDRVLAEILVGTLARLHARERAGGRAGQIDRSSGNLQRRAREGLIHVHADFVIAGGVLGQQLRHQGAQPGGGAAFGLERLGSCGDG